MPVSAPANGHTPVGMLCSKATASDKQREADQIARLRRLAEEANLDPAFAEEFLNFIVAEVIRHHEKLADEKD